MNPARPKLRRTARPLGWVLPFGIALFTLLTAAIVWDNWGRQAPARSGPLPDLQSPALVTRGAYLARLGHCGACHTARGGAALAGGRGIETPFGTVFSSNLTPDTGTGLGGWQADDFWTALHLGRSRGGRLLNPAFPYAHTSVITREDSDALFAWLQQQAPVRQSRPADTLPWPLGTQAALAVWRSLYFSPAPFQTDPAQTPEWNRGAYLVLGLGQCAACHSPRNRLGANAGIDDLSGGLMPGGDAYATNLLSERESGLASTALADIVRLLRSGQGAGTSTNGPMGEVVQQGLQYLHEDDLRAMALYLQSRARTAVQAPAPRPAPPANPRLARRGADLYAQHCAGCHGGQGQGVPGIYPALAGNRAVQLPTAVNLVQTVLYGGYAPATQTHPRPFGMPPFVLQFSDEDIAAVLTHLRTQWGHTAGEVTPLQVHRIRTGG
jgi:mono/diheme cytochrome c family protein